MTTAPDPIRALASAATPGPWKVILPGDVRWEHRRKFRCVAFSRRRDEPYATSPLRPDDAALIVAMRNGIDAILDERDALRADFDGLVGWLVAHCDHPTPAVMLDEDGESGRIRLWCERCQLEGPYLGRWLDDDEDAASPEQGL